MSTGRGGFTVNHHGTAFLGLSQAPVSLVVHAGLATSALLAPRLFSKGDYRHGELSRTLKSTIVGTGVALATLCSGVVLGTVSGHHPERDPPFAYGGGTFSGATTPISSDSMVRNRATGSSVGSGNAGGGRRSTLRSSCPSGQCPHRGPRHNGGGSDGNNNGSSGSGGSPSPPVIEEKAVEVAKLEQSNLLVRNGGAPPPPPPPPLPSTSVPEGDNWASSKKRTSICAALLTAAVLGLLSRKLRYSKPYEHVRYCVPSSDVVAQKPRRLGKFTSAPLNIPLDCGPSGICVLQDHAVEHPEIDPFARLLAVEYAPCPAGYTELHFKDIGSHQAQLASDIFTPRLRPLNWQKILQSVATIQLNSLRFFVIGIGVIMGAFLSLNLLSAVYHTYASRKKHADEPSGRPQCESSDGKCEITVQTELSQLLVMENDIHEPIHEPIHPDIEHLTASPSLIEIQPVDPPVVEHDDGFHLWNLGPPLAISSVIPHGQAIHADTEQPTTSPSLIEIQPVVSPIVEHDDDFHLWDLSPPVASSMMPYDHPIHADVEQPTTFPSLIEIQPVVLPIVKRDDDFHLWDLGPQIASGVMPHEHASHTDVEYPTAFPSLIKSQPVVPPIDRPDDDFHLYDLGPPLAESSLIHPNELDESGFWPTETFYRDDVSFNLDDIYADLQEEKIMFSNTRPPIDFAFNTVRSKFEVEALASYESFNIDDIYVPFDEEVLKTNVTPFLIEKGATLDMVARPPIWENSSAAEVAVAENGSDAPAEENLPIEKGVTCDTAFSSTIPAISGKASIADVAVAQNGFDAPAEEVFVPVDEAQTTFEDFFAMTDSVIQSYMAARDRKGKDNLDSFSSGTGVAFNPLAAPFVPNNVGVLTSMSQDGISDSDSVDEDEKRQRDYRRRRKRPKKIQTIELISEAPESTMAETLPPFLC